MHKLADARNNALTIIKSTDWITAESVLAEAKKNATKFRKETGIDEKPQFKTRAEAKVEPNDRNYAIQATIGTWTMSWRRMAPQRGSMNIVSLSSSMQSWLPPKGPQNGRCSRSSKLVLLKTATC
jgi:hypothetical protein